MRNIVLLIFYLSIGVACQDIEESNIKAKLDQVLDQKVVVVSHSDTKYLNSLYFKFESLYVVNSDEIQDPIEFSYILFDKLSVLLPVNDVRKELEFWDGSGKLLNPITEKADNNYDDTSFEFVQYSSNGTRIGRYWAIVTFEGNRVHSVQTNIFKNVDSGLLKDLTISCEQAKQILASKINDFYNRLSEPRSNPFESELIIQPHRDPDTNEISEFRYNWIINWGDGGQSIVNAHSGEIVEYNSYDKRYRSDRTKFRIYESK